MTRKSLIPPPFGWLVAAAALAGVVGCSGSHPAQSAAQSSNPLAAAVKAVAQTVAPDSHEYPECKAAIANLTEHDYQLFGKAFIENPKMVKAIRDVEWKTDSCNGVAHALNARIIEVADSKPLCRADVDEAMKHAGENDTRATAVRFLIGFGDGHCAAVLNVK